MNKVKMFDFIREIQSLSVKNPSKKVKDDYRKLQWIYNVLTTIIWTYTDAVNPIDICKYRLFNITYNYTIPNDCRRDIIDKYLTNEFKEIFLKYKLY